MDMLTNITFKLDIKLDKNGDINSMNIKKPQIISKNGGVKLINHYDFQEIIYEKKHITLQTNFHRIKYRLPETHEVYSIKDMLSIVLTNERMTRHKRIFMGQIDIKNVYFKGLRWVCDDMYEVIWEKNI